MIPIKLMMKNFMCYREETLNLEGIHLACLSGENGAGKSSLLDAMTWAIWGKGRGTSDNEMVTQNEAEMTVELEFTVSESTYKANRRRNKRGNGKTELALAIYNGNNWTNITESTIRETQNKIQQIVGMKYDTFINSAFLVQGRADEFTTRSPSERKEVLGEILGLAYYDELEQKAKDAAKEAEGDRREFSRRAEDLENMVLQRSVFEAQKAAAQSELATHSQQLAQQEQVRAELQTTVGQLQAKEQQRSEIENKLRNIETKLKNLKDKTHETERDFQHCERIIGRTAEIERGYNDLEAAKRDDDALRLRETRYNELTRQQNSLQTKIEREHNTLHARREGLRTAQTKQEEMAYNLKSYLRELEKTQKELDEAKRAEEDKKWFQEQVQNLREEFATHNAESKNLTEESKKLEVKIKQLPNVGDPCERCGTRLTASARSQTLQQYEQEVADIKQRQTQSEANKSRVTSEGKKLKEQMDALEIIAKNLPTLNNKVGKLEAQYKNAQQAESEVVKLQEQIDQISQQLQSKEYAQAEQQTLVEVERELAVLAYDNAAHSVITKRRAELSHFEREKSYLDSALRDLPKLELNLKDFAESQEQYKHEQTEASQKHKQLESELSGLAKIRNDLARASFEVEQTRNLERVANGRVATANERIENCERAALQLIEVKRRLKQADLDKSLYDDLANAFGKKGIQALVIDSVLPELEEEANQLLGDMTAGRMSVRFDTQRDTRKGDSTIETLDLKISDEQGMRPYEMFSGGEAFRVNFAVRIALSKLLARRNGAQLRTLFIDEGFGTQDGAGRERLIEAIHGIENQFDRMLVITHISELKDAFPVRIEVEKTPNGSRVNIV